MSDHKVRTTSPYITNAQRKENERRWAILDVCDGLDADTVEAALEFARDLIDWNDDGPMDGTLENWKPRAER